MEATPASIRERMPEDLELPAKGRLRHPDPGRFAATPPWAGHPPLQSVTYRTPYARKD